MKYVKVYADYAPSCLLRLTFLFAISTTPLLHAEEKVMPEEARSIAKEAYTFTNAITVSPACS